MMKNLVRRAKATLSRIVEKLSTIRPREKLRRTRRWLGDPMTVTVIVITLVIVSLIVMNTLSIIKRVENRTTVFYVVDESAGSGYGIQALASEFQFATLDIDVVTKYGRLYLPVSGDKEKVGQWNKAAENGFGEGIKIHRYIPVEERGGQ